MQTDSLLIDKIIKGNYKNKKFFVYGYSMGWSGARQEHIFIIEDGEYDDDPKFLEGHAEFNADVIDYYEVIDLTTKKLVSSKEYVIPDWRRSRHGGTWTVKEY